MTTAPESTTSDRGPIRDRIELILAEIEQLPTLPAVATRLLEVTTSTESNVRDVVQIIETDQALTSKILSLVRRANLGVRGDILTVDRAVVLLGFEAVRNAVLSVQIYETFASVEPHDETDFDRSEFWKHSLAVACAAQLLAEKAGHRRLGQEAFVCGLLHDIGKLALDACLPKSYARVVSRTRQRHLCICDVERDVLGLDHTIAGKRLLTQWKLPRSIVECAWLHHQPGQALPASIEAADRVRLVHAADDFVRRQRIGFSGYNRIDPPEEILQDLGLRLEDLAEVAEKLAARIEQNCQLVGLDRLTSTSLYADALADANEELGRVNASLAESHRGLSVRSLYFEALRGFLGRLSPEDRVSDVCRAAARCIADLLRRDRAVAFAGRAGERTWHVGFSGGEPASPEPVLVPESTGAQTIAELSSMVPGRIASAPRLPEALETRCGRLLPRGEPVWMLPFMHAGCVVGGVLFCAVREEVEPHNQAQTELEALSHAFGLAAATASSRVDGQRLNEELAEANRRLHCAQAELLRARSLSMIAQMAAGAAHELNNPLAVISGRSQMLARDARSEVERRGFEIVHEQAQRASQIVTELMEFAKPAPPTPSDVVLARWVASLRHRWLDRSSIAADQFVVQVQDPHVTVRVDPRQADEVFEAILTNAMEAMANRQPQRLVIRSASVASDEAIVIAVEDTGVGMAPGILEHAVDPFFSYRPAGRGRGLGLSRAARLVENNGGRLWLESTAGLGTTVYVELPAGRPGCAGGDGR